jgi:hypothetical protein
MALIPSSHYNIFAGNQAISFGVTSDPNNVPAPVSGNFNLEVITNASGTGNFVMASGYQGLAVLSTNGSVLTLLQGAYGIVDTGGNDSIFAGAGSVSILGAAGDTLTGGSGASTISNYFLDAHLGNQLVLGGRGGSETIWGGVGDTIQGGSFGNETIGGVAGDTIIGGSGGNIFIDGTKGNQSITGGSAGNETIAGVSGSTITGGAANTFIDATAGNESIAAGAGNTTVWGASGDTVQGADAGGNATIAFGVSHTAETYWDDGNSTSAGNDTVFNFTQASGDRVSLNGATDNASTVVAAATADGSGNAVLHLSDGSSVTLVGVTLASLNTTFFTTH